MRTILIAHRDADFAEELAVELRAWGYRVIGCPGPLPPVARCIRCDKGYCPLSEGADLMIYDPGMAVVDDTGEAHNLALDSAIGQPDLPMLLAWSPNTAPDVRTVRAIRIAAPRVQIAAYDPATLRNQIAELLQRATVAV
jgi:hypothetical protein